MEQKREKRYYLGDGQEELRDKKSSETRRARRR
jgi:hypothetical protein